ncbi:MAG TPA: retropepsin-like aspartic protease [Candidatus Baltobacteraceae bacterium]|nr:retropepsin-like aspartic protease [Candidatus Baltobacteraceae bacterium]
MKRASLTFVLLLTAATGTAFARGSKDLDTPPAGVTPATVTVSQILKSYDSATGRRTGSIDTSNEVWQFNKQGLQGTETLLRSGSDYYSKLAAGPLVEEYGQFLGHGWHRDYNGVVSPVATQDSASFEMLLIASNLNDASDPKNDVKMLGELAGQYVVQVKETGAKHPEFVYYDKKSGLIDKMSYVSYGERVTLTFGDYRATRGLTQPWHIHWSDGTASLDDDFVRKSMSVGVPIDSMKFITPASSMKFQSFSGNVKLPAKVFIDTYTIDVGGGYQHDADAPTLVVRVNVNGRGLDFAVSAGEANTIIDSGVARELGLPTYGQTTHADGDDVAWDTVLPSAEIGGLSLHNFAVRALPFHYHANDSTKVVGVLGFDVLSSGVFKMDFDNGTLDLYPASTYDNSPFAGDQGATLNILFDRGYPFIQGTLAAHPSENVLFDNDYAFSYLLGGFVDRYPDAVTDVVTNKSHGVATIPFADSSGYGKEVSVYLGKIPDIQIGPAHFVNYQMVTVDGPLYYGGHEVDAIMGGDVLRYYDVYLDYPHNKIYLQPNKSFFKAFH